jgi:hypothetical protein
MINGTLLVQMLNFYVGYIILTYVILKPALAVIVQQEEHENDLNRALVELKNQVAAQEEYKKRAWHECMQALTLIKPKLEVTGLQQKMVMPSAPEYTVNQEEEQELIAVLAKKVSAHITREKKA